MIEQQLVPIDHFGVAAGGLIRDLINQSSNKRVRRNAMRNLAHMADRSHTIPYRAKMRHVGLLVEPSGQIFLAFIFETEEEEIHEPVQA